MGRLDVDDKETHAIAVDVVQRLSQVVQAIPVQAFQPIRDVAKDPRQFITGIVVIVERRNLGINFEFNLHHHLRLGGAGSQPRWLVYALGWRRDLSQPLVLNVFGRKAR